MSYPILPTMPLSMAKGLSKNPNFNTSIQKVAAGRGNSSISMKPYATWDFEWDMDKIQGNEALQSSTIMQFLGTYMVCNGSNGLFLFTDPQDSAVSYANSGMLNVTPGAAAPMGTTGDGSSTQFQLARIIGGVAYDIIQMLNGSITVKVNGSVVYNYSVSSTGVLTFTPTGSPAVAAPANNATLQWTGNYFFLCRFEKDTIDTKRVYTANTGTDLWDVQNIVFHSEFL